MRIRTTYLGVNNPSGFFTLKTKIQLSKMPCKGIVLKKKWDRERAGAGDIRDVIVKAIPVTCRCRFQYETLAQWPFFLCVPSDGGSNCNYCFVNLPSIIGRHKQRPRPNFHAPQMAQLSLKANQPNN